MAEMPYCLLKCGSTLSTRADQLMPVEVSDDDAIVALAEALRRAPSQQDAYAKLKAQGWRLVRMP